MDIREFSERIGVSTATVSRAFSGRGRISDKTRLRILREAEALGYRANVYARGLSGRKPDAIGFFYPAVGGSEPDYFLAEILIGVTETALALGRFSRIYPISDAASAETREGSKDAALNGSLAGAIVVAGSRQSKTLMLAAQSAGLPCVALGHMREETRRSVVFLVENGARKAGRYFRETGRTRPAYIGGVLDLAKRRGYRDGLGPLAERLVRETGDNGFEGGYKAFYRLEPQKIDCAFCANDAMALGFIRAASERGVKIPGDIAVIGCDDIRAARYSVPSLTTISLKEYEIGRRATTLLDRVIRGEGAEGPEVIEGELIVRESA